MNTNEIKLNVLPAEDIQQIKSDLIEIKEALSKKSAEQISASYIESKQIPKLLNISSKTWQTWRDRRKIPFIQFGSKIWVKRIDLDSFLEKYYVTKKTA